jgi:hypothetical protein
MELTEFKRFVSLVKLLTSSRNPAGWRHTTHLDPRSLWKASCCCISHKDEVGLENITYSIPKDKPLLQIFKSQQQQHLIPSKSVHRADDMHSSKFWNHWQQTKVSERALCYCNAVVAINTTNFVMSWLSDPRKQTLQLLKRQNILQCKNDRYNIEPQKLKNQRSHENQLHQAGLP